VQRDFWPIEHHQQFGFVGMQPLQQAIEGGKADATPEDTVEACPQFAAAARRRLGATGFEVGVKPPDQATDKLLRRAVRVGERLQFVHQPPGSSTRGSAWT